MPFGGPLPRLSQVEPRRLRITLSEHVVSRIWELRVARAVEVAVALAIRAGSAAIHTPLSCMRAHSRRRHPSRQHGRPGRQQTYFRGADTRGRQRCEPPALGALVLAAELIGTTCLTGPPTLLVLIANPSGLLTAGRLLRRKMLSSGLHRDYTNIATGYKLGRQVIPFAVT
jgi:hypothetical protein